MTTTRKQAAFAAAVQEAAEQPLQQELLLSLIGYNCKRAYLAIMPLFAQRMAQYELRTVDFSVLSLLHANPNIAQKRLAQALGISPPNLAPLLDRLEERGLVVRQRNPLDKRSQAVALTTAGTRLCARAEKTASELEHDATAMLSEAERAQLLGLLQKIFLPIST
ncbi:MarR family transcriptional regulator [Massilia sp. WF1]|uniref:MarR family winged helix-turn-helix transcriptional regulator n=1 Tax=unclassified Massilia TaxID=2609279 RepID=UPI00064A3630|nr:MULTISPECIES: MarR family transcriptional regulator [unclassified Massilia]ALK96824.1 MarR family transcriptional regulator [Massilia sp. WG5]KLU38167.1 MarR family transcriptional regulator [Massilia sp. WF1]